MTALELSPAFTPDDAQRIASQTFGVDTRDVTSLPSERDQNFLLRDTSNLRWVLKISNGQESPEFVDGQNQMMSHLADRLSCCPAVRTTLDGESWATITGANGVDHMVRLVSFIEGRPLAEIAYRSPELLSNLGARVGELTVALGDFRHPGFHRSFHWDLANGVGVVGARLHLIDDALLRNQIEHCVAEFTEYVVPVLPNLPKSITQNDANDGNVIVSTERPDGVTFNDVAGIIDFGDAVYSWTVAELAIASAYAILKCADPMTAVCDMVRGYATKCSLSDDELTALFGLIRLRLCVSAVIAAEQQQARPNDEYLSVSQQPIRQTLPHLCEVPYLVATEMLREAAGAEVSPKAAGVMRWLA